MNPWPLATLLVGGTMAVFGTFIGLSHHASNGFILATSGITLMLGGLVWEMVAL